MNEKNLLTGEKGHATVGLLVMILFITAVVLLNTPDLSVTNKVAFASGGGGGGTWTLGPVGGGTGDTDAAVATLRRVVALPFQAIAAGGTSGLVSETTVVVNAISTINRQSGQLFLYKDIAMGAVRNLIKATIVHTISVINKRIVELSAA